MTRQVAHDVLRRMASPPPPAPEDVPITSSRAIRLAITRAADKTHDFVVSVSSLREEVLSLDQLLAALEPELMLIGMTAGGVMTGLAALDLNMRTALLEVQTVGMVLPDVPEDRPPTGTDAQMAQPLIEAFLHHLQDSAERTPLDGWGLGFNAGDKINSTRAAGLILDDGKYRLIRLSLDLGVGDRTAELALALPCRAETVGRVLTPEVTGDWDERFRKVVDGSPARLDAELHRFKLPLHQAENLVVGQVLPLTGCTVSSVKILARDGRKVATARLGQSAGMRAVRIEVPPQVALSDMDQLGKGDMPSLAGLPETGAAFDIDGATDMMDIDNAAHDDDGGLDMPMAAPIDMPEADDMAVAAAPLSWDDEDLEADPVAPAKLSWEDEGLETPTDD